MFIEGFLDPCDAEFQGEQGTAVMGEVLRSGGRGGLQVVAFERTFLPFFLPPSDRSAFGRMHNKKLQTFHRGVFLSLCPFATEISTENDSMIHVQ